MDNVCDVTTIAQFQSVYYFMLLMLLTCSFLFLLYQGAMVLGNTPAGAAATTEVDNDVSRFNLQLSSPTLQLSDISHDPNAPKGFHEEPICPPIRDESSQPIPTTGTQVDVINLCVDSGVLSIMPRLVMCSLV